MRYLLVILCTILCVLPQSAEALSLQVGSGYVKERCVASTVGGCMEGVRLGLGLHVFSKGEAYETGFKNASEMSGSLASNVITKSAGRASSIGDFFVGILVAIFLFMFVAGLIWAIAAILSQHMDFSLDVTYDHMIAGDSLVNQTRVAAMISMRPGASWFVMRAGFGPSYRKTFLQEDDIKQTLSNNGVYRKLGIGFSPHSQSGPTLFADWESEFSTLTVPRGFTSEHRRFLPERGESISYTAGWLVQF